MLNRAALPVSSCRAQSSSWVAAGRSQPQPSSNLLRGKKCNPDLLEDSVGTIGRLQRCMQVRCYWKESGGVQLDIPSAQRRRR